MVKVALISPYELGRQPFGLAEPTALLRRAGYDVSCLDLSLQRLEPAALAGAKLVGLYLAMHTATRIGLAALPRIRSLAPDAHICAFGLYAPANEEILRAEGASTILGGEFEPELLHLAKLVASERVEPQAKASVSLERVDFVVPDRSLLPNLSRYAKLLLPDGTQKTIGFVEGSRGCKHLCRHCPVVPVYQGRFRTVPADVVIGDIRAQVASGAEHISFGDPDFFNGPTHARRLVTRMHEEFPHLTFDATIKVQHLLGHRELLPTLKDTGCLFVTSAVESIDDSVLRRLEKHHTNADFSDVVALMRQIGIALAPTFVAFTPWTSLHGYVDLLKRLIELKLVESVPSIQLAIRLLIPKGSYLLHLEEMNRVVEGYDPALLSYRWRHVDAHVDTFQQEIEKLVERAEGSGLSRRQTFRTMWDRAHQAIGEEAPELPDDIGTPVPRHSEPWYCCAEPTAKQLVGFDGPGL